MAGSLVLFLADEPVAGFLLSPYKPVLALLPIIPFAWLASSVIEKDALVNNLKPHVWASACLATIILAFAAAISIPMFWVGWAVEIVILGCMAKWYWQYRDQRVPDGMQFQLFSGRVSAWRAARKAAKASAHVVLHFTDGKGVPRDPPAGDQPYAMAYAELGRLLLEARDARAGRLELSIHAGAVTLIHTVDGLRAKATGPELKLAQETLDFAKDLAGLDVADRRKKQSGSLRCHHGHERHQIQVNTWGGGSGQAVRLDIDRHRVLNRWIEEVKKSDSPIGKTQILSHMGAVQQQIDVLTPIGAAESREGLVLLCAPPGHGQTILGYGMVWRHDPYTCNVKTLERAVESRLEGIDQNEWDPARSKTDFATALQSIIRRGPDVVLTSDFNDPGTAKNAANGANGHILVYIVSPAGSVAEGLQSGVTAVGDPSHGARVLRAVVAQRLVRRLCEHCRQPFEASPEQAKRLGAASGKPLTLYRAAGKIESKNKLIECPTCRGSGFSGMSAVMEVMPIDRECQRLIAAGDIAAAYQQSRRVGRMLLMQEAALIKVREGITSLEEVSRVFAPPKPAAPKPAAPPAPAGKPPNAG